MSNPNKPQGGALRADNAGAQAGSAPEGADPAAVTPPAAEPPKPSVGKAYRVSKGHGLTTVSRGILGEGEEVRAGDVSQGEERLAELARKGVLTLS